VLSRVNLRPEGNPVKARPQDLRYGGRGASRSVGMAARSMGSILPYREIENQAGILTPARPSPGAGRDRGSIRQRVSRRNRQQKRNRRLGIEPDYCQSGCPSKPG
jgi:hypothetical protein